MYILKYIKLLNNNYQTKALNIKTKFYVNIRNIPTKPSTTKFS